MTGTAIAHPSTDVRTARYLDAERALWAHYGLDPRERILELDAPPCQLRVLEVGSGEPVLLVHGTVGPGSWVSLAAELSGFRSIVLDRPGWGLSPPLEYPDRDYGRFVADLLLATLDALGLERAHVAGGSIGDVWALRLAALHPRRVDRVILLGGGPIVPEAGVPGVIRLIVSPAGALMTSVMTSPASVRTMLRHSGHGASLDAGVIPEAFVEWRSAAARETAAMRHERAMARQVVDGKSYREGLTFDDDELAAITARTLMVYGDADGVGTVGLWRRVVGRMPEAELHVVEGGGHMPWFDDPVGVGERVHRFLTASAR